MGSLITKVKIVAESLDLFSKVIKGNKIPKYKTTSDDIGEDLLIRD